MNIMEFENEYDEISQLPFKCDLCSFEDDFSDYDTLSPIYSLMIEHHVCYQCAYWMYIIKNPPIHYEIVDGVYIEIGPIIKRPLNKLFGGLGVEYYFRKFNGQLFKSNNVYVKGKVPEHFRDKFPDTAHLVTLMDYMKLKKNPGKCPSKGCWERYNCIRYNRELEKDGPFNIVPKNHVLGSCRCPQYIYINKNKKQWFI